MQKWLLSFAKSRKFWLTVVAVAVPVANKRFNLNLSTVEVGEIVLAIVGLVAGIAWEDAAKHAANGTGNGAPKPTIPPVNPS